MTWEVRFTLSFIHSEVGLGIINVIIQFCFYFLFWEGETLGRIKSSAEKVVDGCQVSRSVQQAALHRVKS